MKTRCLSRWFACLAVPSYLAAVMLWIAPTTAESLRSQSTAAFTQSLAEMEADGTKLAFDVASVKPNTSDVAPVSRFALGPGDAYIPGGLFSAINQPVIAYIRFAFKLGQSDLLGLPAWIYNDRFDIEARSIANPSKDQMRLMMQSLLAEWTLGGARCNRRATPGLAHEPVHGCRPSCC